MDSQMDSAPPSSPPKEANKCPSASASTSTGLHHVPSINAVTDFGKEELLNNSFNKTNYFSHSHGARVWFATDEWFAAADHLLSDSEPFFDPDLYCVQGKVMDGWESRRRRQAGHDWCLVQLSERVELDEIKVDTAFFTGNFCPAVSIQAYDITSRQEASTLLTNLPRALERIGVVGTTSLQATGTALPFQGTAATASEVQQAEQALQSLEQAPSLVVPESPLQAGYPETRWHTFATPMNTTATHLRINMHPDGGIARIHVHGKPAPLPPAEPNNMNKYLHAPDLSYCVPHSSMSTPSPTLTWRARSDVVEVTRGGTGLGASNAHYGTPHNLLQDTFGKDMGDGWETARHLERPRCLQANKANGLMDFGTLHDFCMLRLGTVAASLCTIIVDTKHFRGNFPESVMIQGRYSVSGDNEDNWFPLVPRSRLAPDAEHVFSVSSSSSCEVVDELRVTMYPDGGISRIRAFGVPQE